jgi:hypothetical protein
MEIRRHILRGLGAPVLVVSAVSALLARPVPAFADAPGGCTHGDGQSNRGRYRRGESQLDA